MPTQRLATILPPLSLEESLETTRVYSSVGLPGKNKALLATRPVRMPHHSASGPALVGGGTTPRPGELSLAHFGILFLDEFVEFPRHVLDLTASYETLSSLKRVLRGVPGAVYVLYGRDALKMNAPNHSVSERWFAKRETE